MIYDQAVRQNPDPDATRGLQGNEQQNDSPGPGVSLKSPPAEQEPRLIFLNPPCPPVILQSLALESSSPRPALAALRR